MVAGLRCQDFKALLWIASYISFLLIRGFSNAAEIESQSIPCKEGWFLFGEKCYKIEGTTKGASWEEAANNCSHEGGSIVTIHSKELQDFLTAFLLINEKSSVWIGLHDRVNESQHTWEDGSHVDYTNWVPGQPSHSSREWEDCVQMRYITAYSIGMWNDLPCEWSQPYICQSNKDENLKNPDPRFCSVEKGGGWKYSKSCYHIVMERKTWEEAEKYCQETFKGHLVTILDEGADLFVNYMLLDSTDNFWIGINLMEGTVNKWSSGWKVIFNQWDSERSSVDDGFCAFKSKDGKWETDVCSMKLPFVCEVSRKKPPVEDDWQCPDTSLAWKNPNGKFCYLFETRAKRDWSSANAECMRKGGVLASIHSKEETFIVFSFMKKLNIGLFIGLHRSNLDKTLFEWADGSEAKYQNWYYREPNSENEECVELMPWFAAWNDISCNVKKEYICSAKKIPPKKTEESTPVIHYSCAAPVNLTEIAEYVLKYSTSQHMSNGSILGIFICTHIIMIFTAAGIYFCWNYLKKRHGTSCIPCCSSADEALIVSEEMECRTPNFHNKDASLC